MSKQSVGKYLYWSDRAIRDIAEENGIELEGRRQWSAGLNLTVANASTKSTEYATRNRLEEAKRIEKFLQPAEVSDNPPKSAFVRGVGTVSFAEFISSYTNNDAVLLHIEMRTLNGRRIDVCLFGSMDNLRGFETHDGYSDGWTSSNAPVIAEFLASRGMSGPPQWMDEQDLAIEAMKVALHQGSTGPDSDHAGRPETRGFTMGHAAECEYVAEIYMDVMLAPEDRQHLHGELRETERIMVGRPLWVRALNPHSIARYAERRRALERGQQSWISRHLFRRRMNTPQMGSGA
ncbi:DUF7019 family protein [Nocardia sp. Marseille-Q1738]